jgi:alkylation response protein AidB-like acyl-CoA dehydrogenase
MSFELSEEQRELAGTVDRLLADRTAGPRARQLLERPDGWRELWAGVAELGVPGMAAPEEAGGLGLGAVELVAVAEAVGRHLAPGPVVATAGAFVPTVALAAAAAAAAPVTAAPAAAASGAAAPVTAAPVATAPAAAETARAALRAVAEDAQSGALAWADPLTDPARPRVRDGRLSGELLLADAARVDHVALVVADDDRDGAEAIALLAPGELAHEPAVSVDETRPLTRLRADGVDVSGRLLPAPPNVLATAFATAAAELVGTADALVRMSVDYARERQQFGVAIGSFQAVKHRLADAWIAVERARSHVYHAATRAAAAPTAPETATAAHFAKAAASEAATTAARAAVQVHGGIGITREHDVSLLYLRARQGGQLLGGSDVHYLAAVAGELGRRSI